MHFSTLAPAALFCLTRLVSAVPLTPTPTLMVRQDFQSADNSSDTTDVNTSTTEDSTATSTLSSISSESIGSVNLVGGSQGNDSQESSDKGNGGAYFLGFLSGGEGDNLESSNSESNFENEFHNEESPFEFSSNDRGMINSLGSLYHGLSNSDNIDAIVLILSNGDSNNFNDFNSNDFRQFSDLYQSFSNGFNNYFRSGGNNFDFNEYSQQLFYGANLMNSHLFNSEGRSEVLGYINNGFHNSGNSFYSNSIQEEELDSYLNDWENFYNQFQFENNFDFGGYENLYNSFNNECDLFGNGQSSIFGFGYSNGSEREQNEY